MKVLRGASRIAPGFAPTLGADALGGERNRCVKSWPYLPGPSKLLTKDRKPILGDSRMR